MSHSKERSGVAWSCGFNKRNPSGSFKSQSHSCITAPTSTKQVVTFNQKVRYMSRFIHLLSKVISPLQKLENQSNFVWEEEHEECFKEVKNVLSSLPTMMSPNPEETYYLTPSVGSSAIGSVLMQKDKASSYM